MRRVFIAAASAGLAIALLCVIAGTAAAADEKKGSIELRSVNEVEVETVNEKGEKIKSRVDAATSTVVPGTAVYYTIYYRNIGDKPVENVVIANPVPQYTRYLPDTAFGKDARITFSIDGGKSFNTPDKLLIKEKDGKVRPARPDEYTHIRWSFESPLPKGAEGSVGFTVSVI